MKIFLLLNMYFLFSISVISQSNDWTVVGSPLKNSLEILYASPSGVLIARNTQIYDMYYSVDDGATWESRLFNMNYKLNFQEDDKKNVLFAGRREIFRFNYISKQIDTLYKSKSINFKTFLSKTPNGDFVFIDNSKLYTASNDLVLLDSAQVVNNEILTINYDNNGEVAGYIYKSGSDFLYRKLKPYWPNNPIKITPYGPTFASQGARLYGGVYYSDDNGITWEKFNIQNDNLLEIHVIDNQKIYFSLPNIIYYSSDKGQSFNTITSPKPIVNAWMNNTGKIKIQSYRIPNFESFKSDDNGQTWNPIDFAFTDIPYCNDVTAGEAGNVFISYTGPSGNYLRYYKEDDNSSWKEWNLNTLGNGFSIITDYGNTIFAHAQQHGVFMSKDKGKTWEKRYQFNPSNYIREFHVKKDFVVALSVSMCYFSVDSFQTWDSIDLAWSGLATPCITNDFDVYGVGFGSENLVVQNLNRNQWESLYFDEWFEYKLSTHFELPVLYATKHFLDPNTNQRELYFYASYDRGHHEVLKSRIPLNMLEYTSLIYTTKTGHILLHTDKRVLLSEDDGVNFVDISPILPKLKKILNISVSPDNFLYISTIGEGVVRYNVPLSVPSIVDVKIEKDNNGDCVNTESGEPINKQKISLNDNEYLYSDSFGNARFYSHQSLNNFKVHNDNGFNNHCESEFVVTTNPGEYHQKKVLSQVASDCTAFRGRIYSPKKLSSRCSGAYYQLSLCNFGNIPSGNESFVELLLDPYFNLKPEENPDLISKNENRYIVRIKNLGQGECQFIRLTVNVSCDAPLDRVFCFTITDVFSPGVCNSPFIPVTSCAPFRLPKDHKILKIKYFDDKNSNCQRDPGEVAKQTNIYAIMDGETKCPPFDSITFVKILKDTTELTFKYDDNLYGFCQNKYNIEFHPDSLEYFLQVPIRILKSCSQPKIHLSGHSSRRCFDNGLSYMVRNEGSVNSGPFEVEVILDKFFTVLDIHGQHQIVNDSTVRLNIDNLYPGQQQNFIIHYNLDCNAIFGQEHCVRSKVLNLMNGCEMTLPDRKDCFKNTGSFDPNDKRVFINQTLNPGNVDIGDNIEYMIRFQNTGTDTAFTVRIEDYISPKFDITSLVPLNASHEFTWYVENRILIVTFSNILLVDSFTNVGLSTGFVLFTITLDEKIQYGDLISNTASIFFDFNEPIITNENKLILSKPTFIEPLETSFTFEVFPNPSANIITIEWDKNVIKEMDFTMYTILGQEVKSIAGFDGQLFFSIEDLPAGVYVIHGKKKERSGTHTNVIPLNAKILFYKL